MKTFVKAINSTINHVTTLSKPIQAFDAETGRVKRVYTQKEYTYEVNNPMFPMEIDGIKTLSEAFKINDRLNQMRTEVAGAIKAWGYGWKGKEPVVLIYNKKSFGVFYGEDGTKVEWFSSKELAEHWLKDCMFGDFDFYRQLTMNENHSTNKKVLTVRDWLLSW
jgi:hypothetical protein